MQPPELIARNVLAQLVISHATSFDSALQQDEPYGMSRFDSHFVRNAIKCQLLFSPHMLLTDSQLLDHAGIRDLILLAGRGNEIDNGLLDLLREPWKDDICPVVLTSEEVEGGETLHLRDQLLKRKLRIDNPTNPPMEFSSFLNPERDNGRLREIWQDHAQRTSMFDAFKTFLGERGRSLEEFLNTADSVWTEHGKNARMSYPFTADTYASVLSDIIKQSWQSCPNPKIKGVDLVTWAIGTPPASRTAARAFLRQKVETSILSPEAGWWRERFNEAYFLTLSRPFRGGDLTSHEAAGWRTVYRGPETPVEHWQKKKEYSKALQQVLRDLARMEDLLVDLDRVTFRVILDIRNQNKFHDSIENMLDSWGRARSPEEACRAVKTHTEIVLAELRSAGVQGISKGKVRARVISIPVVSSLLGGTAAAIGVTWSLPAVGAWAVTSAATAIYSGWALRPRDLRAKLMYFARDIGKASVEGRAL